MNLYYANALLITTAISLLVAMIAWHRRKAPGAIGLFLMLIAWAEWSFTYAIRWSVPDQASQLFWLNATYLGVVLSPIAIVIFALQFTHREQFLTTRNLLLLAIEPILTLILLWTDRYHGLFFGGYQSTNTILNGGPWFWIHVVYSYIIFILMVVFFAREYWYASHPIYRQQTGTILAGSLIPWVGNVISVAGLSPFKNLDITPFIFIISGLFYSVGLFRFRLMDIVPIAHNILFKSLPDGVIVMDINNRIVEINPSAEELTGVSHSEIGKKSDVVLSQFPMLTEFPQANPESQVKVNLAQDSTRIINVRQIQLFDGKKQPSGKLIMLQDITRRIEMQEQLEKLSITDVMTGLRNRSFFEAEMTRLDASDQFPISLIVVDMDNLKEINDRQGHKTGDLYLQRLANVLTTSFRTNDIVTRNGGDEFVVILPKTDEPTAAAALLRLATNLQKHNALMAGEPLVFSVGCSTTHQPITLTQTFSKADAAMYIDKRNHQLKSTPAAEA